MTISLYLSQSFFFLIQIVIIHEFNYFPSSYFAELHFYLPVQAKTTLPIYLKIQITRFVPSTMESLVCTFMIMHYYTFNVMAKN